MSRKMMDCGAMPSDSGCTLVLIGEEDEVLRAATRHAVGVHGHTDDTELRDGLRAALADAAAPTQPGTFLQLMELHTTRVADIEALDERWVDAIGDARTARWTISAADRDRRNTYYVLVEFPNYPAAMANSEHPATSEFAAQMSKLCDDEPVFRNLDVRTVMGLTP